jgi:hypothetical protein
VVLTTLLFQEIEERYGEVLGNDKEDMEDKQGRTQRA